MSNIADKINKILDDEKLAKEKIQRDNEIQRKEREKLFYEVKEKFTKLLSDLNNKNIDGKKLNVTTIQSHEGEVIQIIISIGLFVGIIRFHIFIDENNDIILLTSGQYNDRPWKSTLSQYQCIFDIEQTESYLQSNLLNFIKWLNEMSSL